MRRKEQVLTLGMKIVRYLLGPTSSNQDPEHIRQLVLNLETLDMEMDQLQQQQAMDHVQSMSDQHVRATVQSMSDQQVRAMVLGMEHD